MTEVRMPPWPGTRRNIVGLSIIVEIHNAVGRT